MSYNTQRNRRDGVGEGYKDDLRLASPFSSSIEEDGLGFACLFGITRMHAPTLMCLDYQKCSLP